MSDEHELLKETELSIEGLTQWSCLGNRFGNIHFDILTT